MKKKMLLCILLCCMLLQSIGFAGCGTKIEKYSAYSFEYFDTVTSITGYAESQETFDEVAGGILAELAEYHKLFTIYHRYDGLENLCTVNEIAGGVHRTVTVDSRIIDMLRYAKEMYEKTNGTVNIAMGSVLAVWHEYRTEGIDEPWAAKLPDMEELTEAAKHTDINALIIDENACAVTLTDPGMRLDVGAVAKGYAAEMVAQSLEKQGISGYVINVGGNVRTVGTKGDGTPWTVGIENPEEDSEEAYLAYLELSGEALVTSGSYQRYYVVDGKRYHHIIDPETLFPSEGYVSVSVVCGSSADGDVLSTALFCMDFEEGQALVESMDGVEAMWVLPDGTRKESSGFANYKKENVK